MNADRLKPLLDKLGIKPVDNWCTMHVGTPMGNLKCYYYQFRYKGKDYCTSDDSVSVIFSTLKKNDFWPMYIYTGTSMEELEKAIKKEFNIK